MSYLTVDEANDLMAAKPEAARWGALSPAQQEEALITGADAIDGYAFKGEPSSYPPTQERSWPRFVEYPYLDNETPENIEYASILLGLIDYLEDDEMGGNITSETHGSYSVAYAQGMEKRSYGIRLRMKVNRLINQYRSNNIGRG